MVQGDECGTSLASIGDYNLDNMRQQRPHIRHPDSYNIEQYPNRRSLSDLVMGCPQTSTGTLSGRLFLVFLSHVGSMLSFTKIPGDKDNSRNIGPSLGPRDKLGHSLSTLPDLDGNGLKEIAGTCCVKRRE